MLKTEVHLYVGQSHQIRQHARTPRACFCRFSPEVGCLPQLIRKNGKITDSTHTICCSVRIFNRFTDGRKVFVRQWDGSVRMAGTLTRVTGGLIGVTYGLIRMTGRGMTLHQVLNCRLGADAAEDSRNI